MLLQPDSTLPRFCSHGIGWSVAVVSASQRLELAGVAASAEDKFEKIVARCRFGDGGVWRSNGGKRRYDVRINRRKHPDQYEPGRGPGSSSQRQRNTR